MTSLFCLFAWICALLVLAPAIMLALETGASFWPVRGKIAPAPEGAAAIIVPAHNEGAHMTATLHALKAQMRKGDRLIVVADNCTDHTAEVAQGCGAEVLVRRQPDKRGKGYALQFGLDHLRSSPPAWVIFFDADCAIGEGAIAALISAAASNGRPAQGLYLMEAPETAPPRLRVAAFAWLMINQVRMQGLNKLASATRFTGAGLAASWSDVSTLDFASGAITEDLVMTLKLALKGAPPVLAPAALITSTFPETSTASVTQRARWEHGSLGVMAHYGVPALLTGAKRMDFKLIMLALDAMIPPLVVFAAAIAAAAMIAAAAALLGATAPILMVAAAFCLFSISVIIGWIRYGRDVLPVSYLPGLVPFALEKLKVYGRKGRQSTQTWTRTGRGGKDSEAP